MENAESPTKNQLNSSGRNVLKELNNLDGAKKSPKQLPFKDDEPATANESSNLLKNLPDIVTTVGDIREDEDFTHFTPLRVVVPNRNLLNTATPDEHQSEDELYFDCNTTLKNTTKTSVLDDTIDNVSAVLNEANQILDEQCLSDSVTQNQTNPNETVIVSRRENLNDGFINVTESSSGNLETYHGQFHATDLNISMKNQNQSAVQQPSEDIKQFTLPNQRPYLSASLNGYIKRADSNRLNETVDTVPNANLQQKEPIDFTTKRVDAEGTTLDFLSSVVPSNDQLVNTANDETRIQNPSGDIQQSTESSQASSGNSTISKSDINNTTSNDISEIDAQSVDKLLPTIHYSKIESIKLNETVDIVPATDHQLVLHSASSYDDQRGVESDVLPSIPCEKSSLVAPRIEKFADITNDLEVSVPVVTHINDIIDVDPTRNDSKATVELKNLSENNTPKEEVEDGICYQKGVESDIAPSIPCEKSSLVAPRIEKFADITNDLEVSVPVVTHINDIIDVDPSRNDSKATVELKNLSENNTPKEEVEDGICYQKGVESDIAPSIPCEKSSLVAPRIEKFADITNDIEVSVPVVTHINDIIDVVPSRNDSKAAVELKNLSETSSPKEEVEHGTFYQESTFILTDAPSNNPIVLISNLDQKTEVMASNENDPQSTEISALKDAEKIGEFEKNQTIIVDSLDTLSETRDCSLDSIEMKKPVQHQAIQQSDEIVTSGKTDEIMTEKDVPAISETLANSEHSFNESNEPAVCDQLLPQESQIHKMPIEREVPLLSANSQNVNQSDFVFKSPLLPNSTLSKMDNQQFQGGDSDFMVLNSNDFDFLQSRGGISVDPEDDRRNSLLLRFDPLLKSRSSILPFIPVVQRVEESAEAEQSLNHIEPLVDLCSNTSSENNLDEQKSSAAKPTTTTNELAMSIGLVHNSNSMDNEAEAYVNNIKSDRTDDKHMQIDSVPLTDKKHKFKYTDGNIQKKMEEYEATQELLLKRITEKDKTVSKNCAIIEAYEKALAELVVEKEKLTENCEINNEKLRQERDIHYQDLMSLETSFSDLHMKYERSKEFILQLQDRLDCVTEEKTKIDELLKQQEMRYEKMKEHALHQLESANATLEEQDKNNTRENSRLKAQLKMEEVTRSTFQEQLFQKKKENEELVKICDELIGGQKS